MRNLKIYRDRQNNKIQKGYRIRVVDIDVSDMCNALTIHTHTKKDADRLELFIHKLLQFTK